MKRFSLFLFSVFLCFSCTKTKTVSSKPQIVTTIFPQYDWISEITKGSDSFDLSLLVENGADLHSFNPSASDIIKIQSADVFVYIGGESDEWIEKVLSGSKNEKQVVVKLIDFVKTLHEEHEEGEECEAEHGGAFDEHIWLSLKNATSIVEKLSEILCSLEPIEKDEKKIALYKNNAASYIEKLSAIDKDFENAKKTFSKNVILVADRFPFLYLVEDYGIEHFAAFSGCSAETEASFETVAFLSKKIEELNLEYVFVIDGGEKKLAKTIIANSNKKGAEILTLDSLQNVSKKDIESGKNYLDSMKSNLESLKLVCGGF